MLSFIAFGSNIEPKASHLRLALDALGKTSGISVLRTSMMYQTSPMYVVDQADFLNAVVAVNTTLTPTELLIAVKTIESNMGRESPCSHRYQRYGPRPIDLDILTFGELILNTPELSIPHPCMHERPFVLVPLLDLVDSDFIIPGFSQPIRYLISEVETASCMRVIACKKQLIPLSRTPIIVAIVNATPDSFAGGNEGEEARIACDLVEKGASIIDVGGQSTRPGAIEVGPEEETRRVVAAIKGIVASAPGAIISVDTYRATVASAAIQAGAAIVNDVSGGADKEMIRIVVKFGTPYFVCHSGAISLPPHAQVLGASPHDSLHHGATLDGPLNRTALTPNLIKCVVCRVRRELMNKVHVLRSGGVPDWDIVLDPGFGFGKSSDENFTLLRHWRDIRAMEGRCCSACGQTTVTDQINSSQSSLLALKNGLSAYPVLIGISRKRFIRGIYEANSSAALAGTIAATIACLDAEMLRVHDVEETACALNVARQFNGKVELRSEPDCSMARSA